MNDEVETKCKSTVVEGFRGEGTRKRMSEIARGVKTIELIPTDQERYEKVLKEIEEAARLGLYSYQLCDSTYGYRSVMAFDEVINFHAIAQKLRLDDKFEVHISCRRADPVFIYW